MDMSLINIKKLFLLTVCSMFLLSNPIIAKSTDFCLGEKIMRVGISSNDFKDLEYKSISFGANANYVIFNKTTGQTIATLAPFEQIKIEISNFKFIIYRNNIIIGKNITGPLGIKTIKNGQIKILGLKRKGLDAIYRGEFEIMQAFGQPNLLSVVNIIELEEYLKGVVPNELPVSFGFEAVKAQAIAARNYAVRPRTKQYYNFDVCDSVQSQVYFGYNTEKDLSNQAIEETRGLYSLYNGDVILALYSSTAGGHTENYENAFSSPDSNKFPSVEIPYLRGVPDTNEIEPLTSPEKIENFYNSKPFSYDMNSRYFRWQKEWTKAELEQNLKNNLIKYYNPNFIYPVFDAGTIFGNLKKIEVLQRGISGKIISLNIITDKGCWTVKKELVIRKIFQESGRILYSANVIFDNKYDASGNLIKVIATGGGFGHGVGMSQYGAGYMAQHGYTFDKILQHYYTGTAIGTWPKFIVIGETASCIEQTFSAPENKSEIVIENPENIKNIKITINNNEIEYNFNDEKVARINIDKYVNQKNNEIFIKVNDTEDGKTLKMWVEVFKAIEKNK